ncbi:hypothetical protein M080_7307, partial [Bacteroides fragilis str. 3397 T10]
MSLHSSLKQYPSFNETPWTLKVKSLGPTTT